MIIIDSREKYLCEQLDLLNVSYEKKQLPLGDIQINNWLFERKTINDLYSSLVEGRFEEQRSRLRELKEKDQNIKIGFFIEGCPNHTDLNGGLAAAIASIGIEFHIICSSSPKTTAHQIIKIHDGQNKHKNTDSALVTQTLGRIKSKDISSKTILKAALLMVPGISINSSEQIIKKYNNIIEFIDFGGKISDIKINDSDNSRKIGKIIESKVQKLFGFSK